MTNLMKLVRLIRVLEDATISKRDKVEQIKMLRDDGVITPDEALELALEYFTN